MSGRSTAAGVFDAGKYAVEMLHLDKSDRASVPCREATFLPPKPLLIAAPSDSGEFPVLLFLHGYLLYNSFYSQLLRHIASHGFIVVAPQMYTFAGPDASDEIKSAAATADWLALGLLQVLPKNVRPELNRLGVAGHSRGGKVAFALALGFAETSQKISALIGIDPVDGMDKGKQTDPPVLTYRPRSLDVGMATMIIGSGLGEVKRNPLFPPCAPNGVNHGDFFAECRPPSWHFVAEDFGHLDMLDDETAGIRGRASYCLCKNGGRREPMRRFVGGAVVAFLNAYLKGDPAAIQVLRDEPGIAPVALRPVGFLH